MLSVEALDLFGQLLAGVQLSATDPMLEAKAALILRVRTELAAAKLASAETVAAEPDGE